jgi:uncharacterized protein with PIN domain
MYDGFEVDGSNWSAALSRLSPRDGGLNIADSYFTYAYAMTRDEPLLFKGNGVPQTGVRVA